MNSYIFFLSSYLISPNAVFCDGCVIFFYLFSNEVQYTERTASSPLSQFINLTFKMQLSFLFSNKCIWKKKDQ